MSLNEIMTLAEAAEVLGLSSSTLRHQAADGRLEARLVGKTWVTTRAAVERYRRDNLGNFGRPVKQPAPEPERRPSGHSKWSVIKAERHARDAAAKAENEG